MTTWYTSDLHFFHKNVVQHTDRAVATTQEDHDEWLVELWNKQVKPNDTVVHAGDFSFDSKMLTMEALLARLQGRIVLLEGNHDQIKVFERLKSLDKIQNCHQHLHTKIFGNKVHVYHFPTACWNQQHRGAWHLHGHSHGTFKASGKILDVGLDNAYNLYQEHRFFSEEDIEAYMLTKEIQSNDYHKVEKETT